MNTRTWLGVVVLLALLLSSVGDSYAWINDGWSSWAVTTGYVNEDPQLPPAEPYKDGDYAEEVYYEEDCPPPPCACGPVCICNPCDPCVPCGGCSSGVLGFVSNITSGALCLVSNTAGAVLAVPGRIFCGSCQPSCAPSCGPTCY